MFKIKSLISLYKKGKLIISDSVYLESKKVGIFERNKKGNRTDIINYLLNMTNKINYLEIGVRNPEDNFNLIKCPNKISVDPGLENDLNPVTFKFTSDVFFEKLKNNELSIFSDIKFDVIFIDGLHLAEQVERDIFNSLEFINDNGFIILHDCNPPDVYYAREDYNYTNGPSGSFWNGTTWKAFYKSRHLPQVYSACIDCDWGVGILTKRKDLDLFNNLDYLENPFFEFNNLLQNRAKHLNLISFTELVNLKIK